MEIKLSDHFTYRNLIRFVFPSIMMMIFTSIYGIVDGLFVSNYVGKTAFAALNLMMPALMIVSAFGFMFGTGGSAIIAKTLGEQKREKANGYFSLLILVIFSIGLTCSILGIIFMPQIARLLKATDEMMQYAVLYGRILMCSLPFFMLQTSFQTLFVTAEKPKLGLFVTVFAGCMNMLLDLILVGILQLGIAGAGLATAVTEISGGLIPIFYFIRKNDSLLHLTKPIYDWNIVIKSATNGASEFLGSISGSLVGMIYNYQLLHYAGENGVAAYGAIMYVNFIFIAIFIGYSTGSAPIIGYNLGALNYKELKNVFIRSMKIIFTLECILFITAFILSKPIMSLFVGYDKELLDMTLKGFKLYTFQYLLCGFTIYSSSFFTALNNGKISAIISVLRTCIFQLGALIILPLLFGLNGIWTAIVVAEISASIVTIVCLYINKNKYHYL